MVRTAEPERSSAALLCELQRRRLAPHVLRIAFSLMLAIHGLSASGCINTLVMTAKVIMGDPKVPATFCERTGIDLEGGRHVVALVVDAPYSVSDAHDTLLIDLQDELLRRMKRKGIRVARVDEVGKALDSVGGSFNAAAIARALDVDVIFHVQIENFSDVEPGNSYLFHGRAQGLVRGFEVRTPGDESAETATGEEARKQVVEVYEEGFASSFPHQPVSADQMTHRVFMQGFVRELAHEVGRQFYAVYTRETI